MPRGKRKATPAKRAPRSSAVASSLSLAGKHVAKVTAPMMLRRSVEEMEAKAILRDQPAGERSMGKTIKAFNALTGHSISERDGWLFMVCLKMARAATTANGVEDDYVDGAAYFALAGESAQ